MDTTKIFELNLYAINQKADILILNETWIKPSLQSEEILLEDVYKIFRLDRSRETHPMDPKKYRTYGGGVLIAIRRDLDNNSTPFDFQCAAAILGIFLKFSDGKNDSFQFLQS